MLSPFLVLKLVNFIEDAESLGPDEDALSWDNAKSGLGLSVALVLSQLLSQYVL